MNKKKTIKKNIKKETWNKIEKLFSDMGKECGKDIVTVAKKLHPDALFMLPVYRGCIVVLKQEDWEIERGSCTIKLYHDPHWMGEELNEETLPCYSNELRIFGQRSGHDLLLNNEELYTIGQIESMKTFDVLMKDKKIQKPIRELNQD